MKPSRHNVPRIKTNILPVQDAFSFARPIPSHTVPLARYLRRHMTDGAIVVEPGCSVYPVAVEIIKQARGEFGRVKVVGIDLVDNNQCLAHLQSKEDAEIGEGRFLAVDKDINTLYPDTLEVIKDDCRQQLQAFLGISNIEDAKIGMLALSGIAHLMSWDRPLDFLLDKVNVNGTVVLAGLPDGVNAIRYEGRELKDLSGHLEQEGYELIDHVFTGNAVTITASGLRAKFIDAVRKATDAEFAANEDYRQNGLRVDADDFGRKIKDIFRRHLDSCGKPAVWMPNEAVVKGGGETVHYDQIHRMGKRARCDWHIHGDYNMPHFTSSKDGTEALSGDHEVFVLKKTDKVQPIKQRSAISRWFRGLIVR